MVKSCVIVRLFPILRSVAIVTFPPIVVSSSPNEVTLALPAIEIVTFALSATAIFDVPFIISVGVTVVSKSYLKLSLHLM